MYTIKLLKSIKEAIGASSIQQEGKRVLELVTSDRRCKSVCVSLDGDFHYVSDIWEVFFGTETTEHSIGSVVLSVRSKVGETCSVESVSLYVDGVECRNAAEIDEAILYCLAR